MKTMTVAGKRVLIFPAGKQNAPLVLLHTVRDEGAMVFQAARRLLKAAFSVAAMDGLDLDREGHRVDFGGVNGFMAIIRPFAKNP